MVAKPAVTPVPVVPGAAFDAAAQVAAIFGALTDPFTIFDRDLRIVNLNDAAAKLLGGVPDSLIGRHPWDALGVPVDDPRWAPHRRVLETREPQSYEAFDPQWQRWYESTLYPIGHGVAAYSRDVTMRKSAVELAARLARHTTIRAEIAQTLADERDITAMLRRCCQALVDHLDVAFARVWTVDAAGENLLLQASAGMYTHVDGAHGCVPVGKFKIGLIAAERRAHLTNDVQHDPRVGDREWARREGMVAFAGYPLLVDGKLIGVLAMFARAQIEEDSLSSLAGIADTIAQGIVRRRTEIELELRVADLARSNADLEQFAYVASHDLQEPLRMVASYNQLIARRYKGKLGEDADEFIGYTVEGVQRMQRLINDLLAYSRVGTRGNDRVEVDMEKVLKIALANLEQTIAEHHATVTSDPLPFVRGDESQLIQLMQNLIGNAIKFHGDEPPRVHIGVGRGRDGTTFSVQDNGIGIDPQYFERIFVIFQRLHPREKYPGTGIGLAICKRIVERHGGRIWVESTPGRGSTILFTIPPRTR
jgi:PAS domain S-box-containing protein